MEFDYDFDRVERKEKLKKILGHGFLWLIAIGGAIALAWAITTFALEKTNMVGSSMEITLQSGDTIIINRLAYLFSEPERFDVVVFCKNGKEHSYYSIKRIIGLPGEKIKISEGKVYINGELLSEPMLVEDIFIPGLAEEEIALDSDEYFVLGDNRNDSEDSRFANVGNVVTSEIIGKAWIRTNKFAIVNKLNISANDDKEPEVETEE